jgi:Na+/alanine symporter
VTCFYIERVRREMVCCFICRGFYHFGRCIAAWVQANSVADGIQNANDTWKSGIVVSLIFGAIVFGG